MKSTKPLALIKRQERRLKRQELIDTADQINKSDQADNEFSKRLDKVKSLLTEAGYQISPDCPYAKFLKEEAYNGIQLSVSKLVYTPTPDRLPWHPWLKGWSPEKAHKFLNQTPVPSWARGIKNNVLNSFGPPVTEGMIKRDGSFNKDLQQLLIRNPSLNHRGIEHHVAAADAKLLDWMLSFFGGKITLKPWSYEDFASEMSNAMKTSSPGMPYNGFEWSDRNPLDANKTIAQSVFDDGRSVIESEVKPPQLFIQGARWTGDGGIEEGQQRLVQQDSAQYKLPGHELAFPLKSFIKSMPGSGQNGVQAATHHIKQLMNGRSLESMYSPGSNIWGFLDWDVSKWDAAQNDEACEQGFFALCGRIFNLHDDYTRSVYETVYTGYKTRLLLTAAGWFKPDLWPSGHSCTTVMAFINHLRILLTIDERVKDETEETLFADFGLQGDDLWAAVKQWSPRLAEIVSDTYARFNCVIKGDANVHKSDDPNCYVMFLNEAVTPSEKHQNFIFPKWNFFWGENFSDIHSYASMDRALLAEILSNVAHPSPKELKAASLLSKLDRFQNQNFYERLVRFVWTGKSFPFPSWIGERVAPNSTTRRFLSQLEAAEGVEPPDDISAGIDREEDCWLGFDELAKLASSLILIADLVGSKSHARRIIACGRGFSKPWRKAMKAVAPLTDEELNRFDSLRSAMTKQLEMHYTQILCAMKAQQNKEVQGASIPESEKLRLADTAPEDKIPVIKRTLGRAILALHEANPFELLKRSDAMLRAAYTSPDWASLPLEHREYIQETYRSIFGVDLETSSAPPINQE